MLYYNILYYIIAHIILLVKVLTIDKMLSSLGFFLNLILLFSMHLHQREIVNKIANYAADYIREMFTHTSKLNPLKKAGFSDYVNLKK